MAFRVLLIDRSNRKDDDLQMFKWFYANSQGAVKVQPRLLTTGDQLHLQGTDLPSDSTSPQIWYDASTVLGKVTLTNIGMGAKDMLAGVVRSAEAALEAGKEIFAMKSFNRDDAEHLIASGLLHGRQWSTIPSKDVYSMTRATSDLQDIRAIAGSLTFSIPGLDAFPLFSQSSALTALAALVAIGVIGDPGSSVELIVEYVIHGVIRGLFGEEDRLERAIFSKRLTRILLEFEASFGRGSLDRNSFMQIIPPLLQGLPPPLASLCSRTQEEVVRVGIHRTQLSNIAEWAFTESELRTIVLGNGVELLATSVTAACMKESEVRKAIVHCDTSEIEKWGNIKAGRGFAIYLGGTAQDAVKIMDAGHWLRPYRPNPPPQLPRVAPELSLYCRPRNAFGACCGYLLSCGILESDAKALVDAFKKDAVLQFSRRVRIDTIEEDGHSVVKPTNVSFCYEYDELCSEHDWHEWFPEISDTTSFLKSQPTQEIQFGGRLYYGFAARRLEQSQQTPLWELHRNELEDKRRNPNYRINDSTVSSAVAEVAGLVYSLALSIVMARVGSDIALRCSLGVGFARLYNHLSIPPGQRRRISRTVVLGILSSLWLGMAAWVSEYPHLALGTSNNRGSVLSGVLTETSSLEEATAKFIVSTAVPDIMVADKPVVLCASYRRRTGDEGGEEVDGRPLETGPHDGCQEVICFTVCAGDAPGLSNNLRGRVLAIPAVGYISCGASWYDYIDMDQAFAVMAKSQSQPVCTSCSPIFQVNWLEARQFLIRSGRGGFSCACAKEGQKLFVPAHGSGLKQAFLCGLFHETLPGTRYQAAACLAHADGHIVIDGGAT